jgi:LemA protein
MEQPKSKSKEKSQPVELKTISNTSSIIKRVVGWLLVIIGAVFFIEYFTSSADPERVFAQGGNNDITGFLVNFILVVILLIPGIALVQKNFQWKRTIVVGVIVSLLVLIVLFVSGIMGTFNGLVYLEQDMQKQSANVRVVYEKRAELIPQLLEASREPLLQEQAIQGELAKARSSFSGAKNPNQVISSANQFEGLLSRLVFLSEAYPQLRETKEFQFAQEQMTLTADSLAKERIVYNDRVKKYNLMVNGFPARLFARSFNFEQQEYWSELADLK